MPKTIADTARPARWIGLAAIGAAAAALWAYAALVLPTSNRREHVVLFLAVFALLFGLYFAAIGIVRGRSATRPAAALTATIFGFAVLFRLLAALAGLPAERPLAGLAADLAGRQVAYEPFLLYDNDLWRYLWDGHVLAEGFDPYRLTPRAALDDELLARRLLATEAWRDVHDAVSFRNYGTIYPPAIHFFFAALARLAPASAGAAKLTLAAADLLLCLVLWRLLAAVGARRELVVAYAWNPTAIKEFSGSGHPDVLMMLALAGGIWLLVRGRVAAAGAALAVSVLLKLASLVTLPLVAAWSWSRRGGAFAARTLVAGTAVLVFGLAPLAAGLGAWLDAFGVFAERWTFNSGPWSAVRWLAGVLGAAEPARAAHWLTRAAIAGSALWVASRLATARSSSGRTEAAAALLGATFQVLAALILLSPAVMPWYVLWALPFAVAADARWWLAFTGLALLSYLNYADGIGAAAWWKWLEYGTLITVAAWDRRRARSV